MRTVEEIKEEIEKQKGIYSVCYDLPETQSRIHERIQILKWVLKEVERVY